MQIKKYTTDAISAAIFKEICRKAEVEVQSYVNRSDIPGGSTFEIFQTAIFHLTQ